MDLDQIRADFPMLSRQIKGRPLIYFDNACMSLRPQAVLTEIQRYYTEMSACAGRSNHRLARAVTEAVSAVRESVKNFIGAKLAEEIIFTRNTTEGINLVANSLELKAGETVLISDKEHNSNLVPWLKLQRTRGIKLAVVKSTPDNRFDQVRFEQALTQERPKLVSWVMTSNLDGVTNPIETITQLAHRAGALVMVDAAQSVPHQPVKVTELEVDFLAFSGHKMMGPSGIGGLYGKKTCLDKMEGFLVGGDTVVSTTYTDYQHLPLPEKFEAGLQDYAGIMGLGAAVDYLTKIGWDKLKSHESHLNQIISQGLREINGLKIIGPKDPKLRGSIVAFYLEGVDPHQIAALLDEAYGIMVRSGQHCVHSWFNDRGIQGSVRASSYFYNTEAEAVSLVEAVKAVRRMV